MLRRICRTTLLRGLLARSTALPRAAAMVARCSGAAQPMSPLRTRLMHNAAKAKLAPGVVRNPLRKLSTNGVATNGQAASAASQAQAAGAAASQTASAAASPAALPQVDLMPIVAAVSAIGIGSQAVRVVPASEVAVEDLFGKVSPQPKASGLHVKNPAASFHNFSLKTSNADFTCAVPSNEGLNVEVAFSVQYRLDPVKVVELYSTVGEDFEAKIIQPQVRAAVRSATAQRDAKALYTSEREQVKADLMRELNAVLNPRGIIVEDAPLRSIVLPMKLSMSIESKLQMEQESQRMDFVLQKERQEAERKRIEAQGIADFQNIVSKGIDDKTLRWKGIEATMELAKSENAKVVVVGSAKDGGLPLILGSNTSK